MVGYICSVAASALTAILILCPSFSSADQVSEQIAALLGKGLDSSDTLPDSKSLDAAVLVPRFYEERDFTPAWTRDELVDELFTELDGAVDQGFRPDDFELEELRVAFNATKGGNAYDQAVFDIIATDAAVKLVHHLVFGKVDPNALDDDWNFSKPVIQKDPAVVLSQFLQGDGFSALIERIDIDNAQYEMLVEALSKYKAIAMQGGWAIVPDEKVLKPGMVDPAVAKLRERLRAEGYDGANEVSELSQGSSNPAWVYDDSLLQQVRTFQNRHGLEADGVIGGKTFTSLNKPVEDRVNKLRLSLERGRWLMRELNDDFVLVNIAGARTYLVKSDGTLWTTRSITGSAYRKTPVFRDEIEYMEFNPTWTVPASIFRKDKLSRIRKDPAYLARNNYVVRNKDGQTIPVNAVNWAAKNPGVTLVQQPGPNNALGLVKFMFPNKYAVYLHDTNDRSLFDRNERNLSSGCVRLEYPFEFASLLMEGEPGWNRKKMQSILDSGKTTRVNLPKPMPVLLTYWTAWVEDGVVHFREDPYERDARILAALDR
ncbi:L,D-transpeptidase family protein [Ruegeria arenilitoris]|uniref:L,D-transpeptidase family protein n=1 Tax=Ruegeria arenilitoris TaxID=1173585 RepID=UPI0020C2D6A4|nr:L,D-transpeptidase family protein [Ruegeria arenilitoris]